MIEVLKTHRYTYDDVQLRLHQNQYHDLSKVADMDLTPLKHLYDQSPEQFKCIYEGDYKVKFMTLNGFKNILRMRFKLIEDQYELLAQGNGIEKLAIDEQTERAISTILSNNWKVKRNGEFVTFYV